MNPFTAVCRVKPLRTSEDFDVIMSIVYLSRPAALTAADVQDIWIHALEQNEKNEITGGLYFGGDLFFHVLEGEEPRVEQIFKSIKADPRHTDVKVLAINDMATAMFRDMPMKLVDGSQSRLLREKFDYAKLAEEGPQAANKAAFKLLRV